jgi:phosphoribosylaminoimidazole-succinocarboxamide synthase
MLTQEELRAAVPHALDGVELGAEWGEKDAHHVRDIYRRDGQLILITTDRIAAFEHVLGLIPYKGQVLNQLSAWWFARTADIIPNHLLTVPDPNVTIAREAQPLPVEVVVRGFITGTTKTSLWYLYEQGEQQPYGIPLPRGLRKNDPLPQAMITPTTKGLAGEQDLLLSRKEIIEQGLVEPDIWRQVEGVAMELFTYGQRVARESGLILVDTKYEFGLINNRLVLIDELHTPDSSRYWLAESYMPGEDSNPAHYDKEYLRLWYAGKGYRGEGPPPKCPLR